MKNLNCYIKKHLISVASSNWKESPIRESKNIKVKWMPLIQIESARIKIGLTSDGILLRETENQVYLFSKSDQLTFLLPCLEISYSDFLRRWNQSLKNAGFAEDFVKLFPFAQLVLGGLKSQSEYWVQLALNWINEMDQKEIFVSELETVAKNGPTQKIKHSAKTLLKSLG